MTSNIEIKVGDVLRDNDARMAAEDGTPRTITVETVCYNGIKGISNSGRRTSILFGSIHTDGKPRKTGFNLVREV